MRAAIEHGWIYNNEQRLWKALGIDQHVFLQLNSIGSLEARANYRSALVAFLENHQDLMSEEEKERLVKNPLRILDTKNQALQLSLIHIFRRSIPASS